MQVFSCKFDLMNIFRSPFYNSNSRGLLLFILLYVGKGYFRRFAVRKREYRNQLVQSMLQSSLCIPALTGIQPTMPRIPRQIFRVNAESNTPFQNYLRNVCCLLLDHFIKGMNNRFDKCDITVCLMYVLIPAVIVERNITVKNIIEQQHENDLQMAVNAEEKFFRLKERWESVSKNDRPSTIALSPKACDHDIYLSLHVLLRICATIPVTSCKCKQQGSVLKCLSTYLRASIGQKWLGVLVFLFTN